MSKKIETVSKSKKDFLLDPHLADYERTYLDFDWKEALKEIEFFEDGKLNAAYVALDKHAKTWRKNKVAIYWDHIDGMKEKFTYNELIKESNKFANVLKKLGIKKGDRVFIFLPRYPQVHICFFGILKVGAIASTVFAAFGPEALKDRLENSGAKMIITTPELKKRIDPVKDSLPNLAVIMEVRGYEKEKSETYPVETVNYEEEMKTASPEFEMERMDPDDPMFMLYTSGTTGKPKGVVHRHGGIVQQHLTAKWVLDLHDEDVYWCTADHGWVTGISYAILGSCSNGASMVIHEGRFEPEKWYKVIENYGVTIWYTAPTAIRMLMKAGDELPKSYNMKSLRLLYSVGEPLNPEAIRWGLKAFGLPFHDTWWQTETGSMLIVNYPVMPIKLGSMGRPFPGVVAGIVDDNGNELPPHMEGNLAIRPGWPSMLKEIWNNEPKYKEYFKHGWYIPGDRAMKDEEGYFWFIGRADDVIKTSGERVGPFEVESVLIEHPAIAEAGVIGKPDALRGEIIKAFLTLNPGHKGTPQLEEEIKKFVKTRLAGHAFPREIEFVDKLPKTRSGKIMRRLLKAKEMGLEIGDTSTLED